MKYLYAIMITLSVIFCAPSFLLAQETVHHSLVIELHPFSSEIRVESEITVPDKLLPEFHFKLHAGLSPSSPTPGVTITREGERAGFILTETFKVVLPPDTNSFVLNYGGIIYHPLELHGKEHARGFKNSAGLISAQGVYLAGSSFWYPHFDIDLITFTVRIELPGGWDAVSQGMRSFHQQTEKNTVVQWDSPQPQEQIFIVAAIFTEYLRKVNRLYSPAVTTYDDNRGKLKHNGDDTCIKAMVFLRAPDEALAAKYLNATAYYIKMYEELIGPYPYDKFALVENFWETGFGMPSFTLLGSRVIRFPFIIHSSYPHEILHNWWGNSVFVDYRQGNWSEGLTSYLADHLIKEQRGRGREYRKTTLQKYTDYAAKEHDFPLTEFTSRYSSASSAVGYGKALMFFHMLRSTLSDEIFIDGLRDFYQKNKFRHASFADLQTSFEYVSGVNLDHEFKQWVTRTGGPKLQVTNTEVVEQGSEYILKISLAQTQAAEPYFLRVPVAITMYERANTYQHTVLMDQKEHTFVIRLPARPVRLDVDPEFDLFRKLDRREIPPALSQTFGAKQSLIIMPSEGDEKFMKAYRHLAQIVRKSGQGEVEIKLDSEIKKLPTDRSVTILGWNNRFVDQVLEVLSAYEVNVSGNNIQVSDMQWNCLDNSIVFTVNHPQNINISLTLIAVNMVESVAGLGRKLPHYHRYSYLAFKGQEPINIAKGRWPVLNSPMTLFMVPDSDETVNPAMGKLAHRAPLIESRL